MPPDETPLYSLSEANDRFAMAMARASVLTGSDNEAKEFLTKTIDGGGQIKNSIDKQIFIGDLRAGDRGSLADLIHDGIHDHLLLLQGFRLQKNNPGKETFSAGPLLMAYSYY